MTSVPEDPHRRAGRPVEAVRNFRPVSPRIATAGQPTEEQLRDVAAAGYAAVVNLGLLDPRYCLEDEAASVAALGMDYHHIPVDFRSPALEDFGRFVDAMDARSGTRVLVHCAANYRASCFVSLYGELRLGWTRAEADGRIRDVWTPDEIWSAFIRSVRRQYGLA